MTVDTPEGKWVVPPHRAIWVPADVEHSVQMSGRVALRSLYFDNQLTKESLPPIARAVNVPALLRELILHTCRQGILHYGCEADERLAGVIVDQLRSLPTIPLRLPIPVDPRARRLAERLIATPAEPDAINLAVKGSGASRRTLERLFVAETKLTLGRWCQRMRLVESLRLLATGAAVTDVAFGVGYNSPSAFIVAFRNELGTTPSRYFKNAQ